MSRYPALAPLHPAIPATDGLILRGHLVYPHGSAGQRYPLAVLAHQYPSTRDSYAPLLADLHSLKIATLSFDIRGHGESTWTPAGPIVAPAPAEPSMDAFGSAFMASAAKVGFQNIADDIVRVAAWGLFQNYIDPTRLLLVGASVGGTGVLLAAPRLATNLTGILAFGAAGAAVHSPDAMEQIRRNCQSLPTPMLLTTSEQDPFDGANNARTWGAGLSHVRLDIVPGADHAMAIYYDVRREVVRFVREVMAPPSSTRRGTSTGRRKRR